MKLHFVDTLTKPIMQEELISYETARAAKKAGFDEKTWEYYNGPNLVSSPFDNGPGYWNSEQEFVAHSAPPQALLAKWLREKRIDITVFADWGDQGRYYSVGVSYVNTSNEVDLWIAKIGDFPVQYPAHEEALEAGLARSLTLI